MEYEALESALGYSFKDKALLVQALTHISCKVNNPEIKTGYSDVFEPFGKKVLSVVVHEFLVRHFYDKRKGEINSFHQFLLEKEWIVEVVKKLGIKDYMNVSNPLRADEKAMDALAADSFAAIIGAICIDRNVLAVKPLVDKFILVNERLYNEKPVDDKTRFQEVVRKLFGVDPTYRVQHESGPSHDRVYQVYAYIGEEPFASASGPSKKEASKLAAKAGLEKIQASTKEVE